MGKQRHDHRPTSTDSMAASLVKRGLASPTILTGGSNARPHRQPTLSVGVTPHREARP